MQAILFRCVPHVTISLLTLLTKTQCFNGLLSIKIHSLGLDLGGITM